MKSLDWARDHFCVSKNEKGDHISDRLAPAGGQKVNGSVVKSHNVEVNLPAPALPRPIQLDVGLDRTT